MRYYNSVLYLTKVQSVGHTVEIDVASNIVSGDNATYFETKQKYDPEVIRDLVIRGDDIRQLVINTGNSLSQVFPLLELVTDIRNTTYVSDDKRSVLLKLTTDNSLDTLVHFTTYNLLSMLLVTSFDRVQCKRDNAVYDQEDVCTKYHEQKCTPLLITHC